MSISSATCGPEARRVSSLVQDIHDLVSVGIDDADRVFLDDVAVIAIVGKDREHRSRAPQKSHAARNAGSDTFVNCTRVMRSRLTVKAWRRRMC